MNNTVHSTGPRPITTRDPVLVGGGKTKLEKKIRNLLVAAAITIIVFLPAAAYLGTVAAASQVAPNYCNQAGGCPWTL